MLRDDHKSRGAKVTRLTADGRGAIAVLRVWGPDAVAVVDAAFRPARGPRLAASAPGRPRLGRIGAGQGDEVVAIVDGSEVEVQCHGGPAAVGLILQALDAEVAPADAWIAHDAGSAIAAEAMLDLARAPTLRTAEILLEQAQGALESEIRRGLESDDDGVMAGLDALIARAAVGLRLIEGWRVVLAGRPNVGKSRLMNALAGFDRAIVDPTPGTTRDVLTARLAIDGWPVELTDTAGLRDSYDPIESAGVDRARDQQRAADLILVVLDRSEPDPGPIDLTDRPFLSVANKADLPAAWDVPAGTLTISAERGDGLDDLLAAISRRLVPEPPPPGAGVPFRESQVHRLKKARDWLASGRGREGRSILEVGRGWAVQSEREGSHNPRGGMLDAGA